MKKSDNINDYIVKQTKKHPILFNVVCICTYIAYVVCVVCMYIVGMIGADVCIINTLGIAVLLILLYILSKQIKWVLGMV